MNSVILENIVWQEGHYYVAQCLNVNISSFGGTKEEALASLKESIELYLEDSNVRINSINKVEIIQSEITFG